MSLESTAHPCPLHSLPRCQHLSLSEATKEARLSLLRRLSVAVAPASLPHVGFSLVVASGGYSRVVHGLLVAVASHCGALTLGAWASLVVAHGP